MTLTSVDEALSAQREAVIRALAATGSE